MSCRFFTKSYETMIASILVALPLTFSSLKNSHLSRYKVQNESNSLFDSKMGPKTSGQHLLSEIFE